MDDWELLRQWSEKGSDDAFRALVERHVNLVYSVARRSVATPSQAEEVVQTVFVLLAQKASRLPPHRVIAGWLYRATRLAAMEMRRTEARLQARHELVTALEESQQPDRLWEQAAPLVEESLDQMRVRERNALVLRFFEGQSLREVGQALGISEEAARKRVDRALEHLRQLLARRGVATTASLLGVALSTSAVQAAPPAMITSVASCAISTAGAGTTSSLVKGAFSIMAWSKAKTATAVAVALLFCGGAAFVANLVTSSPAPAQGFAEPPQEETPAADEGRLGGARNRQPDWRAGLLEATTDEQTNQLRKMWCVDNLKQVGSAAHIWSTNNGGTFPSTLMELRSLISSRYLTCPADDSRNEVTRWADMNATNVTYLVLSPGMREKRLNVITVRCPIHGHVALTDGRVLQGDHLQTRTIGLDNSVQ